MECNVSIGKPIKQLLVPKQRAKEFWLVINGEHPKGYNVTEYILKVANDKRYKHKIILCE